MQSETLDLHQRVEGGDSNSELRRTKESGTAGRAVAMATVVLHETGNKTG